MPRRSASSRESLRILESSRRARAFAGDQRIIAPDRLAVVAPIEREGEARLAFAGVPFALPVMQQAAWRETFPQTPNELVGKRWFRRSDRGRAPFGQFEIVDRDEGRLAPHGQPHIPRREVAIDLHAERIELAPALVRERLRDARCFADALDTDIEAEIDLRGLDAAEIGAAER